MERLSYKVKCSHLAATLKRAATPEDKFRIQIKIARANNKFFKGKLKLLLKASNWPLSKVESWLGTSRTELLGLAPKEALKSFRINPSLSRRAFQLLAVDLGLKLKDLEKRPKLVEVSYDKEDL